MAAPESKQTPSIAASTSVPIAHKKIQDIQPGQWVKVDNPAEEDDTEFGKDVNPAAWKLLKLKAPKLDGTLADVSLVLRQHDGKCCDFDWNDVVWYFTLEDLQQTLHLLPDTRS